MKKKKTYLLVGHQIQLFVGCAVRPVNVTVLGTAHVVPQHATHVVQGPQPRKIPQPCLENVDELCRNRVLSAEGHEGNKAMRGKKQTE